MILLKASLITVLFFALIIGYIALLVFYPIIGVSIILILVFLTVLASVYESIL